MNQYLLPAALGMMLVASGVAARGDELAATLRELNSKVLREGESGREMVGADLNARIKQANQRSTDDWNAIRTKADWEQHRDSCLRALRKSLGTFPPLPVDLQFRSTGEHAGAGYVVRNVLYQSRPGLLVTANLYVPNPPRERSPGILISHSHHAPKTEGELQDMGILWARAGCYVLVPDHLGHGERRQHPFASAADYPEKFQVSRQDYFFRYNLALQLYVAGESLMGWMANDLMRGVDVLLSQPGIDREKIILLGAVAGGGDPAGVAAALDERIAAVVPFNFGGPQPETKFPLPNEAEISFNYAGGGSWESTRNLARSAADGFLPWVIVGSVAPRRLIHAHEFAWDQERDPVWKRYQRIFGFYDAADNLAFTHGHGKVSLSSAEASHCNNIGKLHRAAIHVAFQKWFGIEVDEEQAIKRHPASELWCLSGSLVETPKLTPARELAARDAKARSEEFEKQLVRKPPREQKVALCAAWHDQLGNISPYEIRRVEDRGMEVVNNVRIEKRLLYCAGGERLPIILLLPAKKRPCPVVMAVAQQGKAEFFKQRSELLSGLLKECAVCLMDFPGTGETAPDGDRGRRSEATSLAATSLMLGETPLGARFRGLRTAMQYLAQREEFRDQKWLLYGDSLVAPNVSNDRLGVPLELPQPRLAEPMGPTLALLAASYYDNLAGVAVRGGVASYADLLESPFVHVPLDAIVPGAATLGDLPLLASQSGKPIKIVDSINGQNVRVGESVTDAQLVAWILEQLANPVER